MFSTEESKDYTDHSDNNEEVEDIAVADCEVADIDYLENNDNLGKVKLEIIYIHSVLQHNSKLYVP